MPLRDTILGGLILTVGLAASASAAPLGGRPDLDRLAGVYKTRFENGDTAGERYTSEDILEVVKLSPKTAYVRIHLDFFNYHECDLSVVADLEPDALVYRGASSAPFPCTLKVRTDAKGVYLEDAEGGCRLMYCGARGAFDARGGPNFTFAERRRIRYMPLLLKSEEYAEAVKEHGGTGPAGR